MDRLTHEDFGRALAGVALASPGRWPHNWDPARVAGEGGFPTGEYGIEPTKKGWRAYVYNPPEFSSHTVPDNGVDVRPRPTWQDLLIGLRVYNLAGAVSDAEYALKWEAARHRSVLTDASALPDLNVHVGDGLDHMTGLADMARAAALAGVRLPHIVMRNAGQKRVSVHTTAQLEEILEATRRRENVVESAHNAVMERYHDQARIRDDESADLDDREAAADKALEIADGYEAELQKEIAAYDPDALPADLHELKGKLLDWLEAAAMARVQHIKGVVSQQGVDLPASCQDEADALEAVARAQRLGNLAIRGAADAAAAKAAYDVAVAAIEAVTPLNVPELFDADGNPVAADIVVEQSAPVKLVARHPAGEDIPGAVAVTVAVPGYVAGAFTSVAEELDQDGGFVRTTIALSAPDNAGETVEYRVEARNLCGPARALTVKIARPGAVVQPV